MYEVLMCVTLVGGPPKLRDEWHSVQEERSVHPLFTDISGWLTSGVRASPWRPWLEAAAAPPPPASLGNTRDIATREYIQTSFLLDVYYNSITWLGNSVHQIIIT